MAKIEVWRLEGTQILPVTLHQPVSSMDDASQAIPGGAYTTFRTYQHAKTLPLHEHFHRLEETASLARVPVQLDVTAIRRALHEIVNNYPADESRLRITVDLEQNPGRVYISIEALKVPSAQEYQQGVRVITRRLKRNNPKAKLTSFITTAASIRRELPAGVNEALMIDENDRVLEGLSSNFFAVQRGEIWTAGEGVLSGLTRAAVLEEIQQEGLPLHEHAITTADLFQLDEAFITSASRAVLPVVAIDHNTVDGGLPGMITRRLMRRFQERLNRSLEEI